MGLSIDESSAYETEYLQRKLNQLASDPVARQQAKDLGWNGGNTKDLKNFMASFG